MREIEYHLSIAPELDEYRPEIEHACAFIEACHPLVRAGGAGRVLHYGSNPPANAIVVPAVLFPEGVRVDSQGLHPRREHIAAMMQARDCGLIPLNPAAGGREMGYDALGLIFLMLGRLEERDFPQRDRYGRYPASATMTPLSDGKLYPWADRAARDVAAALMGTAEPPSRTRYEFKFTHDVDMLRGYHRPFDPIRTALGDALKRGQPARAVQRLKTGYFAGEPWRSFRHIMDVSEQHDLKSCFYFMGPSQDFMDSPYVATMPELLGEVVDEVRKRGHLVGFHPCFHTFNDSKEWMRQRDGLEAVIGIPVREGRHHVLRYDAAVTPRIWSDAGMALDCTPSYPEVVGFRTGTCRLHQAYDLVARRTLPLKQISTAVMEFGLFGGKYRDLTVEQALDESLWAANLCREFGGTFTVLFHTSQQEKPLWTWIERLVEQVAH